GSSPSPVSSKSSGLTAKRGLLRLRSFAAGRRRLSRRPSELPKDEGPSRLVTDACHHTLGHAVPVPLGPGSNCDDAAAKRAGGRDLELVRGKRGRDPRRVGSVERDVPDVGESEEPRGELGQPLLGAELVDQAE